MSLFKTLLKISDVSVGSRSKAGRPSQALAPACETMEERKLMNAAWGPPHGFAAGTAGSTPPSWAHVQPFDATDAAPGGHGHKLGGPRMGPAGRAPGGHSFSPPSAQLKADFDALQADRKTLESEIPADLKAAVQADQAVIQKAFSSQTPAQRRALGPADARDANGAVDPTTHLAADLTAAGVSSDQANAIVADFQNLKTALTTTDPTLQAKITADQAAIVKDGGPSLPAQGFGMPGRF